MTTELIKEPISKVDTAWLRMEQPTNLMMINGVIMMDDNLDYANLLKTVEQRFLTFRRFRQKAVDGARGAFWVFDEDFDIRLHVRRTALPGAADRKELELLASELASTPLDSSRPLWQFHVVENYIDGPVVIVRIHHCIADGIALVQVFLSLTDPTPEGRPSARKPDTWKKRRADEAKVFQRLLDPAREGLGFATHLGQKLIDEGSKILQNPAVAGNYAAEAGEIVRELAHSLTLENDPITRFKKPLGTRKQVAWAEPLSLDEVKSVSKAFGCTVNDVLIAAVTGAFRQYMISAGDDPDSLKDIRATVPVNLRPLEHALELGNHFGLVFLSLPLSVDNPLDRLYAVNDRMNELKSSKQAAVTLGFLAALGLGPSAVQKPVLDILSQKATAVLTNVPGPQQPLYLAGSQLKEMMFWVPQNGNIGLGISILSYNGKVFFGLISDYRLVSEPSAIISRFKREFEKLLYLGMMLPLEGRPDGKTAEQLLNNALEEDSPES
ncbi:MAG: wax ester/triacylglycerol synthase family O-acyltransferase [Xanthomonadales bacterium]|nr:wax ester/triacylglycerol synthase family O-acyltransferase [Xanthomonadales bacterium]